MYNVVTNIKDCLSIASDMVWGNINIIYYSHIPVMIVLLFIGIFVLIKSKDISAKPLFILNISLALWVFADLITWVSSSSVLIMFFWSILGAIEGLFILSTFYFAYTSIYKKYPSFIFLIILFVSILPIIIMTPTDNNLSGFIFNQCTALDNNFLGYIYLYEIIISVFIILISFLGILKTPKEYKKPKILLTIGVSFYLILYFLSGYLLNITGLYSFQIYGFVGMVIFSTFLAYLIVRFEEFNIKLIATQALVWGITFLIGSQFFFIKITTNLILNGIAFIGVIVVGRFLIRSVRREIDQVKRLEILRLKLEESNFNRELANDKLKELDKLKTEFLSIASHQLRSPLTAISGYTSMILENDYGDISPEVKEITTRVYKSSKNLTKIVEDLLNVSKIEQGGMKYEMNAFDLKDLTKEVVDDLSINAKDKNLNLSFNFNKQDSYIILADKEKIRQVILNILDNSIKYTKIGGIDVGLKKLDNKVILSIKDTGIGIKEETKKRIFSKFERGEGVKVNSDGSGLGLYLAKEIIEAHNGYIWAESKGEGEGSTFIVELKAIE